jgi:hypothetical protein
MEAEPGRLILDAIGDKNEKTRKPVIGFLVFLFKKKGIF